MLCPWGHSHSFVQRSRVVFLHYLRYLGQWFPFYVPRDRQVEDRLSQCGRCQSGGIQSLIVGLAHMEKLAFGILLFAIVGVKYLS